jgi:hypothetical protein
MRTFTNHRGVAPMLWVFFSLAMIELMVAHLFVSLKWPILAWPLTVLTAVANIWLFRWIRSWARSPHELHPDYLRLHMGSLRHIDVPLAQIESVIPVLSAEQIKGRDTSNLVPIAFPNRLIELSEPLSNRRSTRRIAIRLDDPVAFDEAIRAAIGR